MAIRLPYRRSPDPVPFDLDAMVKKAQYDLEVHITNMAHEAECDIRLDVRRIKVQNATS